MVTIIRKDLGKFEGQSKVYRGWFKLDSGLKKIKFLQLIHNSIKDFLKRILNIKTRNYIQRLLYRLIKNISRKICKKRTKHDYSIRSTSTRINIGAQTSK